MALDALTATGSLILDPLRVLWFRFVDIIPGLVAAIILLIIGYFVALGIGYLVRVILERGGVDKYWGKGGKLAKTVGHAYISDIIGEITKWYIFIIFLQQAVEKLSLGTISALLGRFAIWLPNVIIAALVIVFGVMFIHYVGIKIEQQSGMKGVRLLSRILKFVFGIMLVIIALNQIGVNISVLERTFLILVGAVGVGIAIAIGVGLGKAMQPESRGIIKELKEIIHH